MNLFKFPKCGRGGRNMDFCDFNDYRKIVKIDFEASTGQIRPKVIISKKTRFKKRVFSILLLPVLSGPGRPQNRFFRFPIPLLSFKTRFAGCTGQIRPKVILSKKSIFQKNVFSILLLLAVSGPWRPRNRFSPWFHSLFQFHLASVGFLVKRHCLWIYSASCQKNLHFLTKNGEKQFFSKNY